MRGNEAEMRVRGGDGGLERESKCGKLKAIRRRFGGIADLATRAPEVRLSLSFGRMIASAAAAKTFYQIFPGDESVVGIGVCSPIDLSASPNRLWNQPAKARGRTRQ